MEIFTGSGGWKVLVVVRGFNLRCVVEVACNEKAASGHLADSCCGKLEQTKYLF